MDRKPDDSVLIVGAGIVGLCCALSLIEKGERVRLLDRDEPGKGASLGNAGVISPWSCVPQSLPGLWKSIPRWLLDREGPVSIPPRHLLRVLPWALAFLRAGREPQVRRIAAAMDALNRPNVDLYRHHLAGSGHEDLLRDSWYVQVYRDGSAVDFESLAWRLREERGAPIEAVEGDALREIEPALSPDYRAALLIKDQARAVSPGRLCAVLAEKVRRSGGEISRATVRGLSRTEDGSWSLATDSGAVTARRVVIAAGAWSAPLLASLDLRVPLEPERGYHLVFRDPGVTLNNTVMEVASKFVSSSMEMGLRSAGTAEFAGFAEPPDLRRAEMLKHQTRRMLPDLNLEDTEPWTGLRPSLPDSLPCLGEIPGHQGLIAAFGHSHYGLGMAPMTGRVVAELATGATPNIDLAPYAIDRFGR